MSFDIWSLAWRCGCGLCRSSGRRSSAKSFTKSLKCRSSTNFFRGPQRRDLLASGRIPAKRGADVRPDFNWDRQPVRPMGYHINEKPRSMPGLSIFSGRRSVSAHAWAGPVEAVDQFGRGGLFDSAAMIDRLNRVRYAASNTETPNCTDLIVVPALKFREANFVLPKQPPDREPAIGEGVFGAAADDIAAASLVGQHKSAEGAKTNW